jgi:predicted RNase H-like HicB family nuclease
MKVWVALFEEDGWVIAECPALPGCVSQGRTREEALANIKEAIDLSIKSRRELGMPVPSEVVEVDTAA